MQIIKEEKIKETLTDLKKAFELIKESYGLFSKGEAIIPKTQDMKLDRGMFYSFPCFLKGHKIFISKQATDFRKNKELGLPTVHPYIDVYNSENGKRIATIEGRYFAGIRTALSSALGIEQLKPDFKRVAVYGSGVQAKAHVQIISRLFDNVGIKIYSPTKRHREKFAKENNVVCFDNPNDILKDVDVVICATSSSVPVFDHKYLKKGALVIGVGAMVGDQEIPIETVGASIVILDSLENKAKYDEITLAEKKHNFEIKEIGQIVNEGFTATEKNIIFKHHGLPVTDAAFTEFVLRKIKVLQ